MNYKLRTANETQLTETLTQSQQTLKQLKKNNQALESELSQIKKLSANAINLDNNNRKLLQNNEMLKIEIAELQADNARLADKSDKEWFARRFCGFYRSDISHNPTPIKNKISR